MNMSQQVLLSVSTTKNIVKCRSTVSVSCKFASLTLGQMVAIFVISLCVTLSSAFRGPHHPRGSISHHHYVPQKDVKITQDANLLHDTTHLKEDLGPMADQLDFSRMTEQEMEFYYFKSHDFDNNTKLDGLEILHAIQHTFHENRLADAERENFSEENNHMDQENDLPWIVGLIDRVLEEDDLDNDGYLGYSEYVLGRERDHVAQAKRKGNKLRIGKMNFPVAEVPDYQVS